MKYYFALLELDDEQIKETQGKHIYSALQELKSACTPYGKFTLVNVKEPIEYKRVEREIMQAIK